MTQLVLLTEDKNKLKAWFNRLSEQYSVEFVRDFFQFQSLKTQFDLVIVDMAWKLKNNNEFQSFVKDYSTILVGPKVSSQQQISCILEGAHGYCENEIPQDLICKVVEKVLGGEIWIERQLIPRMVKIISEHNPLSTHHLAENNLYEALSILTEREVEVIERVYMGQANTDIAEQLGITVRTVKAHLGSIFKKLNVQDRFQLVVLLKNLHVEDLYNEQSSLVK